MGSKTRCPGQAPAGERGLSATGHSLPQLMKNGGYATGFIGKWHLGYRPEFNPKAHGFDYFFGFISGSSTITSTRTGTAKPDLFENHTPVQRQRVHDRSDHPTSGHGSSIENAQRPFFLEVAYNAAHWPSRSPIIRR